MGSDEGGQRGGCSSTIAAARHKLKSACTGGVAVEGHESRPPLTLGRLATVGKPTSKT